MRGSGARKTTVRSMAGCTCCVSLALFAVLGASPSIATAATFNWYGQSPDCWQTGAPWAPSSSCDFPGGGLVSNGITGDITEATGSGDYCNVYNVNSTICDNEDATWPLSFKYTAACEYDVPACGIQHYVSLASQDDEPWAAWAGAPALVISTELAITKSTAPTDAWAYLCPVIEVGSANTYIEDCFDEWQGTDTQSNLPEPPFKNEGYGLSTICASPEGRFAADQVVTAFESKVTTPFGRTLAGSTVVGGKPAATHFEVEITAEELANVIRREEEAVSEKPRRCGRSLGGSGHVPEYRLVGIENGIEGGGHTQLGATVSNLRAWTEYTPLRPSVTTETATEAGPTTLTFRGKVNPNGYTTKYYFQYGKTPQYESSTKEFTVGPEADNQQVSTVITGLKPGTTYYYRIVASSSVGEEDGKPESSATLYEETSSRWAMREETSNTQFIFYRNNHEGEMWETLSPNSGAEWGTFKRGLQVAPGTVPVALRNPATGYIYVFYQNVDGVLWEDINPGTGWGAYELSGAQMASGASPTAVVDPTNGYLRVFYEGRNGTLWETANLGSGWDPPAELGGHMSPGTSPTAVVDPHDEYVWVFYQSANGELSEGFRSGSGWELSELGGQMALDTSPSAVREPADGYLWVFYQGASGKLSEGFSPGSGWKLSELGVQMAPGTSPSALHNPTNGYLAVYYQNDGGILSEAINPGSGWGAYERGAMMAPGTSPAALQDPDTGELWVYYEDRGGELGFASESGTGWKPRELGVEMSPSLPMVGTRSASGVQESTITLHGVIDPQGTDTKYYFEYGPTASYGSKTAELDAGSGVHEGEVSQTVTGLKVETVYHYRLVATSSVGTSYGQDVTVTTQEGAAPGSSPAAVRDTATGTDYVFFQGRNHELYEWEHDGSSWTLARLGGSVASGTSPSAVCDPQNGYLWVFFHGSNGTLWEMINPGTGWGLYEREGDLAEGTSPSVIHDPVTSDTWVFYQGANSELWETTNLGSGWKASERGEVMAAGTSPSAIHDPASGYTWVFYQGSNGRL
jgi:hypothetical protein